MCTLGENGGVLALWRVTDGAREGGSGAARAAAGALTNLNFGGRGRLDLPAAGRNVFYSANENLKPDVPKTK